MNVLRSWLSRIFIMLFDSRFSEFTLHVTYISESLDQLRYVLRRNVSTSALQWVRAAVSTAFLVEKLNRKICNLGRVRTLKPPTFVTKSLFNMKDSEV